MDRGSGLMGWRRDKISAPKTTIMVATTPMGMIIIMMRTSMDAEDTADEG